MAQSIAFTEEKRREAMRFRHIERMVDETLNFEEYFEEGFKEARSHLRVVDRTFRENRVAQVQMGPSGKPTNSHRSILG